MKKIFLVLAACCSVVYAYSSPLIFNNTTKHPVEIEVQYTAGCQNVRNAIVPPKKDGVNGTLKIDKSCPTTKIYFIIKFSDGSAIRTVGEGNFEDVTFEIMRPYGIENDMEVRNTAYFYYRVVMTKLNPYRLLGSMPFDKVLIDGELAQKGVFKSGYLY